MGLKQVDTLAKRQDESIFGYNEDLLFQVLIRLASKSVVRFKCVSKYWYSLISDPHFVESYLEQYQIGTYPWAFVFVPSEISYKCEQKKLEILADFALHGNKKPLFRPDFCFLEEPQIWGCVVGSFNDLILCGVGPMYQRSCYYICNPVTKEYVALPPPPPFHPRVIHVCDAFICEPFYSKDNNCNLRYRFRVVLMPAFCHRDVELRIFASETGLWSVHRLAWSMRPIRFVSSHSSGLVISLYGLDYHNILVFDPFMATSKSSKTMIKGHEVNMPMEYDRGAKYPKTQLSASEGRVFLSQILIGEDNPNSTLTVWELLQPATTKSNHDKEWNWRMIHSIPFGEMAIVESDTDMEDMKIPSPFYDAKCFLGNFLKDVGKRSSWFSWEMYSVISVGFDPTDANIIFLIIASPNLDFETLASCNLRTRSIKLVPICEVPVVVGKRSRIELYLNTYEKVFPFVLQPWPTPLPKLGNGIVPPS